MLMSQAAISSGAATRPRFALSANAALQINPSASAPGEKRLSVDMLDLPARGHAPGGDAVEMVDGLAAAPGNQVGAGRLNIAALVAGAALQHGGAAVPAPRDAGTGEPPPPP